MRNNDTVWRFIGLESDLVTVPALELRARVGSENGVGVAHANCENGEARKGQERVILSISPRRRCTENVTPTEGGLH